MPVDNCRIIPISHNAGIADSMRKKSLRPRLNGILVAPCVFPVAIQAMYEDDAGRLDIMHLMVVKPANR